MCWVNLRNPVVSGQPTFGTGKTPNPANLFVTFDSFNYVGEVAKPTIQNAP